MKNPRMPKGWTFVGTNDTSFYKNETREEKLKKDHKFDSLIQNTSIRSEEKMLKENNLKAEKDKERKESLIQAFEEKKLKSKTLIKEAKKMRDGA